MVGRAHDERRRQPAVIDEGAVRALEIDEDVPAVALDEPRVVPRDVAVGEHDVVTRDAAQRDLAPLERVPRLLSIRPRDDERAHPIRS